MSFRTWFQNQKHHFIVCDNSLLPLLFAFPKKESLSIGTKGWLQQHNWKRKALLREVKKPRLRPHLEKRHRLGNPTRIRSRTAGRCEQISTKQVQLLRWQLRLRAWKRQTHHILTAWREWEADHENPSYGSAPIAEKGRFFVFFIIFLLAFSALLS